MVLFRLTSAFLVLAACGNVTVTPDARSDDSGVPDDGGGDGGNAGSNAACTASAALRCEGATLVSCNADGTGEIQTACALRCDPTALACHDKVNPSNGFAAQLDAAVAEPALAITSTSGTQLFSTDDFDATTGTIQIGTQTVKGALVAGTNGAPDVVVLSVGSFTVGANVTLNVQGARALAIMSAGDVTIAGTLELVAGFANATEPCFGTDSGASGGDGDYPGGGGGGFGTPGAGGGGITGVATGKSGGTSTGNDTLVPLRGGCKGGGDSLGGPGRGGGAGQITSATKITVSGRIGANGTGGAVSSGGGSGGGILLEAPTVTITGGIYANGGGGGCGGFSSGANGTYSTTPANGASCGGAAGTGTGGNGGAGTTAPTAGTTILNRSGQVDRAGGGGGAVGRIRINTLDMTVGGSGAQSPPASKGLLGTR